MAKATLKLKDKQMRIYIPKDVCDAERLRPGDFINIDVVRVDVHERQLEEKR